MTDAAEPLIVAAIRRRPTGLLHHKPQGVGGTGTTAAGFLREYDNALAAAEARGARAERDRRMDYAVVKGYELGYVEALREAAEDVFRAASTSGDSPVFRGEIADWLLARAAAASGVESGS